MTRDFFKDGFIENDFYPSVIRRSDDNAGLIKQVVDRANAILKAELEKAPLVYRDVKGDWFAAIEVWRDKPNERRIREGVAHSAKLVRMEERRRE